MATHLANNVFDWHKDGANKIDELKFQSDGTYLAAKGAGSWYTIDEKTMVFMAGTSELTIEFNEEGSEGILVQPVREPASRMTL